MIRVCLFLSLVLLLAFQMSDAYERAEASIRLAYPEGR